MFTLRVSRPVTVLVVSCLFPEQIIEPVLQVWSSVRSRKHARSPDAGPMGRGALCRQPVRGIRVARGGPRSRGRGCRATLPAPPGGRSEHRWRARRGGTRSAPVRAGTDRSHARGPSTTSGKLAATIASNSAANSSRSAQTRSTNAAAASRDGPPARSSTVVTVGSGTAGSGVECPIMALSSPHRIGRTRSAVRR